MRYSLRNGPYLVTQSDEPDFVFRFDAPRWESSREYWTNSFVEVFVVQGCVASLFFYLSRDPPLHLIAETWIARLLLALLITLTIGEIIRRLWSKAYQEFRIADGFLRISTSSHSGRVIVKEFELSEIESLHEKIDFVAVYIKLKHEKKAREMFRYPLESRHKEELTKLLALRLDIPLIHEKRHFFRIKGNVWS